MRGITASVVAGLGLLGSAAPIHAEGEAINGFPNWEERVMHEWTNRARCDPQFEMAACGANCAEGDCYTAKPPLPWHEDLNRAARFHSDNMAALVFFNHDSACDLVANLDSLYPATCNGAASCACVGGTKSCTGPCTTWTERVSLFGTNTSGEIIASGGNPNDAFYQWLFEDFNKTACGYDQGPPTNGHRWNILESGPNVGYGKGAGQSVGDFGASARAVPKIPSGSHYPRQAASVEAWANWYDTAGPMSALINVDGTCSALSLQRGSVMNGAYRGTLTGLASGCHRYFFLFKDSTGAIVTYPTTGSLGLGPAGSCADWDSTRPATGAGCDCTPQCSGKTCGDDSCGGSCGNCEDGESCEANACVAAATDAGPGSGSGSNNGGDAGTDGSSDNAGGCGCDTGSVATRRGDLIGAGLLAALLAVSQRRRRVRAR